MFRESVFRLWSTHGGQRAAWTPFCLVTARAGTEVTGLGGKLLYMQSQFDSLLFSTLTMAFPL